MRISRISAGLMAFFLLCVFVFLALNSARPDMNSPTCDELAHHIPVGYILLDKGDFQMDPSQPPLARYIMALPLKLFMDLNVPADKNEWRRADRSLYGKDFFYKYNIQPDRILFLARTGIVAVGFLCGLVLFTWTRRLYGDSVALFGLFLYSFSPNILANASLATTDMAAACFIFIAVVLFWVFVENPSFKKAVIAGICLGLAELAKYSAVICYPVFFGLFAFEFFGRGKKPARMLVTGFFVIVAVSIITIWAGYGFNSDPILFGAMRVGEKVDIAHRVAEHVFPFWTGAMSDRLDGILFYTPMPLGVHILGVLGVIRHGYEGHGTFLCGRLLSHGDPLFFVLAFLVKTPIPMIVFLSAGVAALFRGKIGRNERFLIIPIGLFFVAASFSKLQIGLRHILPIYPFCFIAAARGAISAGRKTLFRVVVVLLMVWYVFSSILMRPHYLSYFNEFIGGPSNGYKYLRGSDLDWGQDLPALAAYLKENDTGRIKLLYFGTAEPASYGIDYESLTEEELIIPEKRVYAISVHKLETVQWTSGKMPSGRAGYSILIYDMR